MIGCFHINTILYILNKVKRRGHKFLDRPFPRKKLMPSIQ